MAAPAPDGAPERRAEAAPAAEERPRRPLLLAALAALAGTLVALALPRPARAPGAGEPGAAPERGAASAGSAAAPLAVAVTAGAASPGAAAPRAPAHAERAEAPGRAEGEAPPGRAHARPSRDRGPPGETEASGKAPGRGLRLWLALAAGASALALAGRSRRLRAALAAGGRAARGAPWWLLALALASGLRARADRSLPPARDAARHDAGDELPPGPTAALAEVRARAWVGPWRSLGGARGWVDAGEPAQRLELVCEGPAPPDGARVAVLPGEEAVPWPRGPVPGPRAREGRFDGLASLRPDEMRVLDPWPRPGRLARWREDALARLEALDRRAGAGGLLPALVLGSTRALERETLERFERTGTRHLLAVSGLHVGLVAWSVAWLFARLAGTPRGRARLVLTLGLLGLYAALSGARPSVLRAALAAGLVALAPWLAAPRGARATGRRADALSLWSLALLLELVRDPLAPLRLGVQLSYLATLGLLVWGGSRAPRAAAAPAGLPSAARSAGRALLRPLAAALRGLRTGLAASAAAVLASLPLVWRAFGEWSPLGVVATPLALPCVLALLVQGALETALPGLVPPAAVHAPARVLVRLLEAFDALPGTPVPLPPRPLALLLGAALLAFAARHAAARRPRGAVRLARASALCGALLCAPWAPAPAGLEVVALDVGAGSALVARAPGLSALVLDAGSRNRPGVYDEALGPLLRAWDVRRPVVALTHLDRDHSGALEPLVARTPPRLWLGPLPEGLVLPGGVPQLDAERGALALPLAPGLAARWLRGQPSADNEGSRSLLLEDARAGSLLLCGDAEGPGLAAMLADPALGGPLALLLFPHHGSDTPELAHLLARTAPRAIWISAEGRPPVASELARRGLAWRSTASGPLCFPAPSAGNPATGGASRSSASR